MYGEARQSAWARHRAALRAAGGASELIRQHVEEHRALYSPSPGEANGGDASRAKEALMSQSEAQSEAALWDAMPWPTQQQLRPRQLIPDEGMRQERPPSRSERRSGSRAEQAAGMADEPEADEARRAMPESPADAGEASSGHRKVYAELDHVNVRRSTAHGRSRRHRLRRGFAEEARRRRRSSPSPGPGGSPSPSLPPASLPGSPVTPCSPMSSLSSPKSQGSPGREGVVEDEGARLARLGDEELEQGHHAAAIEKFEAALDLAPKDVRVRGRLENARRVQAEVRRVVGQWLEDPRDPGRSATGRVVPHSGFAPNPNLGHNMARSRPAVQALPLSAAGRASQVRSPPPMRNRAAGGFPARSAGAHLRLNHHKPSRWVEDALDLPDIT